MADASIQDVFLAFREQCIWLRCCYNTYLELFESDETIGNLLHKAAGLFFYDLNLILIEYIFLRASALTDPAKTFKNKNLTVKYLNIRLKNEGLITDEIVHLSDKIHSFRCDIVDARNKLISHTDLKVALDNQTLGQHDPHNAPAFFENINEYADAVGIAVGVGPSDFRTLAGSGDVHDLLRVLRKGVEKTDERS